MPMVEDMCGRFPGVKVVIDHAGKPDLKLQDPWPEFRKMFRLKKFPQVWISNSEPYEMSEVKKYPYEDTWPFYKAIYEEFGGKQLVWGTGYPRPRWELPMDKELEFVDHTGGDAMVMRDQWFRIIGPWHALARGRGSRSISRFHRTRSPSACARTSRKATAR